MSQAEPPIAQAVWTPALAPAREIRSGVSGALSTAPHSHGANKPGVEWNRRPHAPRNTARAHLGFGWNRKGSNSKDPLAQNSEQIVPYAKPRLWRSRSTTSLEQRAERTIPWVLFS